MEPVRFRPSPQRCDITRNEGSIPFTRSTDNQGLTNQCSKSAVNPLTVRAKPTTVSLRELHTDLLGSETRGLRKERAISFSRHRLSKEGGRRRGRASRISIALHPMRKRSTPHAGPAHLRFQIADWRLEAGQSRPPPSGAASDADNGYAFAAAALPREKIVGFQPGRGFSCGCKRWMTGICCASTQHRAPSRRSRPCEASRRSGLFRGFPPSPRPHRRRRSHANCLHHPGA